MLGKCAEISLRYQKACKIRICSNCSAKAQAKELQKEKESRLLCGDESRKFSKHGFSFLLLVVSQTCKLQHVNTGSSSSTNSAVLSHTHTLALLISNKGRYSVIISSRKLRLTPRSLQYTVRISQHVMATNSACKSASVGGKRHTRLAKYFIHTKHHTLLSLCILLLQV